MRNPTVCRSIFDSPATELHRCPVVLHVRRRRWLDKEGHNVIINPYPLVYEGTRYSEEFAVFLKGVYGNLSGDLLLGSSPLDR